jgi:hypothetical protein
MMILRVESARGEAGSIPPTSGAPEPRLWGAARRIDKAELQEQSVCFFCNSYKGPNIAGLNPQTGRMVRLFNPRKDRWSRHFTRDGPVLVGRTLTGRVTIALLEMNRPEAIEFREYLLRESKSPL